MRGGGSLRSPGAALCAAGRPLRGRGARFARGAGRAVILAVVMSGFGAAVVTGQEPVPERLGFEDAVRVALERNPAFLRQANDTQGAEYSQRQSFGQAFLPSLSASVGYGGGWSRNLTGLDDFGRPTEASGVIESTGSNATQGLNAQVPLFSLESIRSYAAARDRTAAQEAAVEYQAALLRTQVGQAYFGALQRDQLVLVAQRNLETARQSLEAIRELLRVAARQPTDVLGAELQVAQAEQALREARGEAQKARLTLATTLGADLRQAFELTSGFVPLFDPATLDAGALVGRALVASPRMAQQEAATEAARTELAAARAARFPTLGGSLSYRRSLDAVEYNALGQVDLPNQGWSFSLSLSLPVFQRFGTATRIGQAGLAVEDADESMREARLQLESEVRSALIDLESAHAGVLLAERQVELGRERLEQGQTLYRLGTIGYTDLQTMIDQLSGYERGLITARFNFTRALLALEEKVGGPVRP